MKIRAKLILFLLPMVLVSVGVMTLLAKRVVVLILEQEVARRGFSVGAAEDPEVAARFRRGDGNRLLPLLQVIAANTQAVYVAALDTDGQVLAHTNVAEKGKVYADEITLEALAAREAGSRRTQAEGRPVLDVSLPIWDQPEAESGEEFLLMGEKNAAEKSRVGTLRLGLPLEDAMATAGEISTQVFWIILIVNGLGMGLTLLFIRRVLQPIRQLAGAAERIGRGAVGERVETTSSDEIGDLARSFNRMSQDLAATTVSKDFLNSIVESMQDALVVTTADGRIRMVNRGAQELLKTSESDLLDRHVFDLVRITRLEEKLVVRRLRTEALQNVEVRALARSGEEIPVLVSASAFRDADGKLAGYVTSFRDITERVEAEEARRQLERQLIQSERMASVGTVVSGIVHNLKNPLMGIHGYGELLKMRQPDLREADRIVASARQMSEMIENILAKSRQRRTADSVDLNALLERELDFMQADMVFKHEVEKQIELGENLPSMRCVYTDFSQVFGNLLRNAVEAMHGREAKKLRVSSSLRDDEVVVEIEDTGCGISESDMESLFDPFFTTKFGDGAEGGPQGTGLGLYTVYQILESYGARVEVESTEGVGTTFRVRIPVSERDTP